MNEHDGKTKELKVLPATADEHAMESVFFEPPM